MSYMPRDRFLRYKEKYIGNSTVLLRQEESQIIVGRED